FSMCIPVVKGLRNRSMCRIAGVFNPKLTGTESAHMVTAMCNKLIHGGPDDGGVETMPQTSLTLGNRRLALQDLSSAGHQPMHYANRFCITYNGELYNFPQLKQQLEKLGHH